MKHSKVFSLVGAVLLPVVKGVAFGGPAPTEDTRALDGITPKPTLGPSINELSKRQTNLNPETCGWVDGDFGTSPVQHNTFSKEQTPNTHFQPPQ
jgi:hypothetical protein